VDGPEAARNVSGTLRCHPGFRGLLASLQEVSPTAPKGAFNRSDVMNLREMVFSIPEGGQATLAFPEPVTLESIEVLEEASALMFRSVRRNALEAKGLDAGAIEYDSWVVNAR
jgi:hypothetical protein